MDAPTRFSTTIRRPPPPPDDDEDDWDAVIALAKMRAAVPRAATASIPPELQVTPPPVLVRPAPARPVSRLAAPPPRTPGEVRAKLDAIAWGNRRSKRP